MMNSHQNVLAANSEAQAQPKIDLGLHFKNLADQNLLNLPQGQHSYSEVHKRARHYRQVILRKRRRQENYICAIVAPGAHPSSVAIEDYLALLIACWSAGAVALPLHGNWPTQKLRKALDYQKVDLLCIDDYDEDLSSGLDAMTTGPEYITPLRNAFDLAVEWDRPCLGILSSGTTGTPKVIVHTFRSLWESAASSNTFYGTTHKEVFGSSLPLSHVGGLMPFLRALISGAQMTYASSIDSLLKSEARPTILSIVGAQLFDMLEKKVDAQGIRAMVLGGSAIMPELINKAITAKYPISLSYGLTESAAQITATPVLTKKIALENLAGGPLPGRNVEVGSKGELTLKGQGLFWGQLEEGKLIKRETAAFIAPDSAVKGESGIVILGRTDLSMICGGHNIDPQEIENVLKEHPNILEAVVVPRPHDKMGQVPFAWITWAKKTLPKNMDEILEWAKEKLPEHALPKEGHFSRPSLRPENKQGRANKRRLAEVFFRQHMFPYSYHGNPANPMLVFLHGFLGQKEDWPAYIKALSEDYSILCLDLPGHGENNHVRYKNWDAHLAGLKTELENWGPLKAIVGYSMGGRLALGLVENGLPVEKAIFLTPSTGPKHRKERKEIEDRDRALLKEVEGPKELKSFLEEWYQSEIFADFKDSDAYTKTLKLRSKQNLEVLRESQRFLSKAFQPNYFFTLVKAKIPSLYIAGEKDVVYADMAKNLRPGKNLSVEICPDAGHAFPFEKTDETLKIMTEFLKDSL